MKAVYIILALVAVGLGGLFLFNKQQPSSINTPTSTNKSDKEITFQKPQKSAHYESNTPAHGEILAGLPINVVIDFNFDLSKLSEIKIEMNGQDYSVEETVVDENKLSMRRQMDSNSPDGVYTVSYNACWPDGSCHDGNFQFAVNRKLSENFDDQTGKPEVTLKMSEIMFKPQNIKVSKGTKVTWINNDSVEHYINTDSHPAHTYYLDQNSKALGKGGSYSITLENPGIYPYHCSAHAGSMLGSILVE